MWWAFNPKKLFNAPTDENKLKCCSHPDRSAVTMQSEQKRWRHSLVVMVFFNMSRQMGHISSLCRERGDTATSVPSMMASWMQPREETKILSAAFVMTK